MHHRLPSYGGSSHERPITHTHTNTHVYNIRTHTKPSTAICVLANTTITYALKPHVERSGPLATATCHRRRLGAPRAQGRAGLGLGLGLGCRPPRLTRDASTAAPGRSDCALTLILTRRTAPHLRACTHHAALPPSVAVCDRNSEAVRTSVQP